MPQRSRSRTNTRNCYYCKKGKQTKVFLNRYNFAYAGGQTINQPGKVAPSMIKEASSQINNIVKQRIEQGISQGSKELKRVLPKILRSAIEDVHPMPFRLLRNFEKKQFNKIKNKILN